MSETVTVNEFVSEFCKIANEANQKLHKGVLVLPNEEVLARIVDEAWKASLTTEEGRPTRFRILYRLRDDKHDDCFHLTEPRQCDAGELVRLAPAIGLDMRRLVVESPNGTPTIVGIEDEILHSSRGLAKSVMMSSVVYFMDFIELTVLGPARVRLTQGAFGLEHDKGMIREFVPAWHFPEFHKLIEHLSETSVLPDIPQHPSHELPKKIARMTALARSWIRLLRRIRNSGHGGGLLILPTKGVPENDALSIKYLVNMLSFADVARKRGEWDYGFVDLRFRAEEGQLTEEEQGQFDAFLNEVLMADKELAHLTDAIAGMAALDGAVLFSSELEVLGFGSRIHVRSEVASGEVDLASMRGDGSCEGKRSMNTFGLRHLSAYEFVALNEGGIAFVISQDGAVRAFTNYLGKILLYDHLELTDTEFSIQFVELLDKS